MFIFISFDGGKRRGGPRSGEGGELVTIIQNCVIIIINISNQTSKLGVFFSSSFWSRYMFDFPLSIVNFFFYPTY